MFDWAFTSLGVTYWIDVCQSDGNMLASGDSNKQLKIFDKRKSKIVQTFDGIHTGNFCFIFLINHSNCYYIEFIHCVRWSPSGDMIASASADKTVALVDFKTGKKLYTGKTSDKGKFSLFD